MVVGVWGALGEKQEFCGPFDDAHEADEWAHYNTDRGRFDSFIEVKPPEHFTGD